MEAVISVEWVRHYGIARCLICRYDIERLIWSKVMLRRAFIQQGWVIMGLMCLHLPAVAQCDAGFGHTQCGAESVSDLNAVGPVLMEGTRVRGHTQVRGILKAMQVQLNTVDVQGMFNVSHARVKGAVSVSGALQASHTQFEQRIEITTNRVVLNHSQAVSMVIKPGDSGTSVVVLRGHSQVQGSIVFTRPGGEVWLYDGSTQRGSIEGGRVVKKS